MADVSALSIIGLGKLGLPLAACFASAGFEVIGVDCDERKLALDAGRAGFFEPGLEALLARCGGRLRTTASTQDAVAASEMTLVVVPTPSDGEGAFSLDYLLGACESIGDALARKDGYHLVVVTSTVMPGATAGPIARALEEQSGRRVGTDLGLCYSPEFIALGSVIHDFRNPDFLLVGESDRRAGDLLCTAYATVCENDPPTARMSFVNAELAKLSLNSFLTMKISFANMLGGICERLPGAEVDVVTSALGLDRRIGAPYLRSGVSFGGPCLPRDNRALALVARESGTSAGLAEAADLVNDEQIDRLCDHVLEYAQPGSKVAVLGLAYKPGTDVVEHSAGLLLAQRLAQVGIVVSAFDPVAGESAALVLAGEARIAESLSACVAEAGVVVVATPWPEFSALGCELERLGAHPVIIDCWRILAPAALAGCRYVPLGSWVAQEPEHVPG